MIKIISPKASVENSSAQWAIFVPKIYFGYISKLWSTLLCDFCSDSLYAGGQKLDTDTIVWAYQVLLKKKNTIVAKRLLHSIAEHGEVEGLETIMNLQPSTLHGFIKHRLFKAYLVRYALTIDVGVFYLKKMQIPFYCPDRNFIGGL